MARPTTVLGSKLLLQIGDGAEPTEAFVAPCALTSKGINFSAESNDFNIPDCDSEEDAVWTDRVVSALSAGVSGSGTLATESLDLWEEWFFSAGPKNIRVKIDKPLAQGGRHYAMSAILTSFNITGNIGELSQIEVEIASNGEVVPVPAAA